MRELLPQVADRATAALSVLQPDDRAAVMAFTKTTALTQPLTADFGAVAQGIRAAMSLRIGLDTDINQALWSAADYLQLWRHSAPRHPHSYGQPSGDQRAGFAGR